jgi:hypothetical protein
MTKPAPGVGPGLAGAGASGWGGQLDELSIPGQLWLPVGGVEPAGGPLGLGVVEPVEAEPELPEVPVEAELEVPELEAPDEAELVEPALAAAECGVLDVELAA